MGQTELAKSERMPKRERVEIGNYLVIDPEICHGQMTFKGTRVPVEVIFAFLAEGYSMDMLLRGWPQLTRPAIEEAIELAWEAFASTYGAPRHLHVEQS